MPDASEFASDGAAAIDYAAEEIRALAEMARREAREATVRAETYQAAARQAEKQAAWIRQWSPKEEPSDD